MQRTQLQLDIQLPSRRVKLNPPEDPLHREIGDTIMDVVKRREKVARAYAMRETVTAQLDKEQGLRQLADCGYTFWGTNFPIIGGWYEVVFKKAAYDSTETPVRMFYDVKEQEWSAFPPGMAGVVRKPIKHLVFVRTNFWRGLSKPAPQGYSYSLRNKHGRVVLAC